jgi:flagellar motor switch protein FliG
LLLALGEDEAVNVLMHLDSLDVQKIGATLASLTRIEPGTVIDTVEQFSTAISTVDNAEQSPNNLADLLMRRVLGPDRAAALLGKLQQNRETVGIESLRHMDAQTLAELIELEHPQIIATILIHLDPEHGSKILSCLNSSLRTEVMLRVATLEGVTPMDLKELNDVLQSLLSVDENLNKRRVGGTRVAAEIMNNLDGAIEDSLMLGIKEADQNLAQQIMDEMFRFEDIVDIENISLQIILREIPSSTLNIALKGADQKIKDKIFSNMSSRASAMLASELENLGPIKRIDVENRRKEIMQVIRKMVSDGIVTMQEINTGDQYVV